MSDYYETDYDSSYYERELRRREFRNVVKKRRRKAFFALFALIIAAGGIITCMFFGLKYIFENNLLSDSSEYIEDIQGSRLSVCYNIYGGEGSEGSYSGTGAYGESGENGLGEYFAGISAEGSADVAAAGSDSSLSPYEPVYDQGLIIVDAGHGGEDGGAVSSYSNESTINLDIAYWLKEELLNRGYSVYMTRIDDTFVGLNARATLANAQTDALAMVSIHQNAYPEDTTVRGVEAHTYEREGCGELGALLSKHVATAVSATDRGVFYHSNLVVTSKTTMPSVIIECGYMTNDEEAYLLTQQDYQIKIARGIADALDEFIKTFY